MFRKIVLVLVSGLMLGLCACESAFDTYRDHISELRADVYHHSDAEFCVDIVSGWRERAFALDGIRSQTEDFLVITVVPTAGVSSATDYNYALRIDQSTYSGQLVRHPFNENYSVELALRTHGQSVHLTVGTTNYTLENIHDSTMIDHQRAFELACKRLSRTIDSLKSGGKLRAEIFVRLIPNPISTAGGYYWYVAFVDTSAQTYAVLIDPISEKIVAVRE